MSRPARPELLALLADVKENPDDLTPWLVLTDWLEEHGDEADRARAEYCRLCFDKLGKKTYASDWEKGERRRELFRAWKREWMGGLAELPVQRCSLKRGLLHLWVDSSTLFRAIDQGLPAEVGAWVERLEVHLLTPSLIKQLALSPLLEGPTDVRLHCSDWYAEDVPDAIQALVKSPYLNHVRALHLRGSQILKRPELFASLKKRFGKALHTRLG
jgi:uncharacterized protein (TIGR02996 family)